MKKNLLRKIIQTIKQIGFRNLALDLFLPALVINWFLYFAKYYNLLISFILNLIVVLTWIIYLIRVKEEIENEK